MNSAQTNGTSITYFFAVSADVATDSTWVHWTPVAQDYAQPLPVKRIDWVVRL